MTEQLSSPKNAISAMIEGAASQCPAVVEQVTVELEKRTATPDTLTGKMGGDYLAVREQSLRPGDLD